jgi:hypothetical protein
MKPRGRLTRGSPSQLVGKAVVPLVVSQQPGEPQPPGNPPPRVPPNPEIPQPVEEPPRPIPTPPTDVPPLPVKAAQNDRSWMSVWTLLSDRSDVLKMEVRCRDADHHACNTDCAPRRR